MVGRPPSLPAVFPRPKIPIQLAVRCSTDTPEPELVRVELKQTQRSAGGVYSSKPDYHKLISQSLTYYDHIFFD